MAKSLNKKKLQDKQWLIGNISASMYVGGMIALGNRLGLYKALSEAGSVTADELAQRTGLHERWLLEWLRAQAAAGIVDYKKQRFSISPEAAHLLADGDSSSFAAGRIVSFIERVGNLERLPESFRTGLGYTWDQQGPAATESSERARRAWYRDNLVSKAIPQLAGVVAKLEAGARVADIGSGGGIALIELAKAYPRSQYFGYDISEDALARAASNAAAEGVAGISWCHAERQPLPDDASFDLIMTLDCLHDMAHPEHALNAIRRALKPDGTLFILDVDSEPTFEANVAKDAMNAASQYSTSIFSCLASSMSEPDAVGYGTVGLPEPKMRELLRLCGFNHLRRLNLKTVHALYEARI